MNLMERKYELTDEKITVGGTTLYRIRALRDIGDCVKAGDLGGFIKSENNLSHSGSSWVYGNAHVYDNAQVYGNAWVCGNAYVYGDAYVYGYAYVRDNAIIQNTRDYIVFKNWWSSGRYFTWTRSNDKWTVGCFHGTGQELIVKAYKDSELSGREYERIVNYVESIKDTISKL